MPPNSHPLDRVPFLGAERRRLAKRIGELNELPKGFARIDFSAPKGDPGLFGPDSMTWRVHANPGSMFIGGITAVLLELAEPRVRSGVWDYTEFKTDPIGRMRRTGMAAMVTTYGTVADVETVTARVRQMHDAVQGKTPDGTPYRANDPELLAWVGLTASYGFLRAYVRYAAPGTSLADQDRYYAEGRRAGAYFGAPGGPSSVTEARAAIRAMRPHLRNHEIVHEFLEIVSNTPVLSSAALPVQRLLVQASIDLVPSWLRELLDLEGGQSLRVAARPIVRGIVALSTAAGRGGIPAQACKRVGVSAARLSARA